MLTPDYPIRTERLDIRPLRPDDFEALFAYQSRADVTRYLYWGPLSEAEARARLEKNISLTSLAEGGDVLNVAVDVRETGKLVGDLTFFWRSAEHHQGEVGYAFNPEYSGRGYATEATRELLRLGFEELGLHRICGRLDARNTASARVLERLGMRREAHMRENEFLDGEWSDELVYAMLAREWREQNNG